MQTTESGKWTPWNMNNCHRRRRWNSGWIIQSTNSICRSQKTSWMSVTVLLLETIVEAIFPLQHRKNIKHPKPFFQIVNVVVTTAAITLNTFSRQPATVMFAKPTLLQLTLLHRYHKHQQVCATAMHAEVQTSRPFLVEPADLVRQWALCPSVRTVDGSYPTCRATFNWNTWVLSWWKWSTLYQKMVSKSMDKINKINACQFVVETLYLFICYRSSWLSVNPQ